MHAVLCLLLALPAPNAPAAASNAEWTHERHLDLGAWAYTVRFDPSSERLVAGGRGGKLKCWNLGDGSQAWEPAVPHDAVMGLAFSPSGALFAGARALAPTGGSSGLYRCDASGSRPVLDRFDGNAIDFLDGTSVLAGTPEKTLRLVDIESGHPLRETPATEWVKFSLQPAAGRLAVRTGFSEVSLLKASDFTVLGKLVGDPGDEVMQLAFSPTDDLLAEAVTTSTAGWGGRVQIWDAARGERASSLGADAFKGVRCVAWSPDGTLLAAGCNGTVRLWDPRHDVLVQGLEAAPQDVWGVAFSPDGRRLAFGDATGNVEVWSRAARETQSSTPP